MKPTNKKPPFNLKKPGKSIPESDDKFLDKKNGLRTTMSDQKYTFSKSSILDLVNFF